MYEIKDPENVVPEIKNSDVILMVIGNEYDHPSTNPESINYVGYIYKASNFCYCRGTSYRHVACKRDQETPSIPWDFQLNRVLYYPSGRYKAKLESNIMHATILKYNELTEIFQVAFYRMRNESDLYELIEKYNITNITLIKEILTYVRINPRNPI